MRVLVVGDVIIDRYTHGTRRGISAETPTIVANFQKQEMFVGGAGLVVRNLLRLGNSVTILTVGSTLTTMFRGSADAPTSKEMTQLQVLDRDQKGWIMTEKHRYFVEQYKLLQFDTVNKGTWSPFEEDAFVRDLKNAMQSKDAVVVCDNRHGVLSPHIAQQIVKEAQRLGLPVYVDSQISQSESNHLCYKGANFIFMNEYEMDCVAKFLPEKSKEKLKNGRSSQIHEICKMLGSNIVYKRGERGAVILCKSPDYRTIVSQGFKVDAVDTCGAGDAFLAAFVSSGNQLESADRWAALSTTYKGTIVPQVADLEKVK